MAISFRSWASERRPLRAASSRLSFRAGETRQLYTALFRIMHYTVVHGR